MVAMVDMVLAIEKAGQRAVLVLMEKKVPKVNVLEPLVTLTITGLDSAQAFQLFSLIFSIICLQLARNC